MIVHDEALRERVTFYGILEKSKDSQQNLWQFESNQIQEYLAAKALLTESLKNIKKLLFPIPNQTVVNPFWIGTLSFLLSILDKNSQQFEDMLDWIKEELPELLIKVERDKLESDVRLAFVKTIFEEHKSKETLINHTEYSCKEIALFGDSPEMIDYLLEEVNTLRNITNFRALLNGLEILKHSKTPFTNVQKQNTIGILLGIAFSEIPEGYIRGQALVVLTELKLNNKNITEQVVKELRSSQDIELRKSLYIFLIESDFLENNVDIFLEGIKYNITNNTATIYYGYDYTEVLSSSIAKIKSLSNIEYIINYFIDNIKTLKDSKSFNTVFVNILDNIVKAYYEKPQILEQLQTFFLLSVQYNLDDLSHHLVKFFEKTNTRLKVFEENYLSLANNHSQNNLMIKQLNALILLTDSTCLDLFIDLYSKQPITDSAVWVFQNKLGNDTLYKDFNDKINKVSNNKFIIKTKEDYESEKKNIVQKNISPLFDKSKFINEVELLFAQTNKTTLTKKDILDLLVANDFSHQYSEIILRTLSDLTNDDEKNPAISLNDLQFETWHWDWFCINKLYSYFDREESILLSNDQKQWVANWCNSKLGKVDFKTALTTDITLHKNTFRANSTAVFLWFFLRKLDLQYPKHILLDLLSFDWSEKTMNGYVPVGIEYLQKFLTPAEIKERILSNLEHGIKNPDVLKNHIDYCKENNIPEVLPYAVNQLTINSVDFFTRKGILEAICSFPNHISLLESIVSEVSDSFRWNIFGKLLQTKSKISINIINNIILNPQEPINEKLNASLYLMMMEDIRGVEYFVNEVKQEPNHINFYAIGSQFYDKSFFSILTSIKSFKFLKDILSYVIEILQLTYHEDFFDESLGMRTTIFNTLQQISSYSNILYQQTNKLIRDFINQSSSDNIISEELNEFISKIEKSHYLNKSVSIDNVINHIENIRYII